MYRNIGILTVALLFFGTTSNAQDDTEDERITFVEVSQGFGGNFYLNYLEYNPSTNIHIGHGREVAPNTLILAGTGVELYDQSMLIPLFVRAKREIKRQFFFLDLGYSIGVLNTEYDYEEYQYHGGILAGLGYGITIWRPESATMNIIAAYQYRKASLTFEPLDVEGELKSKYHFNHIAIGASLEF